MSEGEFNPDTLINILPLYYKRLFPFEQYYKWLSYGSDEYISRREFSFTFIGDIYVRYQSFDNLDALISTIQKKNPMKIDIGGIYNVKPKHSKRVDTFGVVQKEVVFDIDMTDYDEVRSCCSGAQVCPKCWKLMVVACKILDVALREDFGYQQLLWVFSGRRGIHCWVCDPAARKLHRRGAVAEYLTLIRGGAMKSKKVLLRGEQLHHSVARAYRIAEPYFEEICLREQQLLSGEERLETFFKLLRDLPDLDTLKSEMVSRGTDSVARWDAFLAHYRLQRSKGALSKSCRHLQEEIVLQWLYPRLDVHVTKGFNHLLKSPFCVHPKSGKVSVPFSAASVEKFNPLTAPTITTLVQEINQFDEQVQREQSSVTRIKDYKKTSLYKGIVVFENFVRSLDVGSNKLSTDASMEF